MTGESWHLDKRVPIALIVTLLTYGAAGLWFVADIKRDVEVLKAAQLVQRDRDERQDRDGSEGLHQLREAMREMNAKLDRLIERVPRP